MDEPVLQVRDGARIRLIPLTELIAMADAARDIAEAAIVKRDPDAVATGEAAMRQEDRCKAAVTGFLLHHYMSVAQHREQARSVVVPQNVGAPTPGGEPAAATPGAAAPPPGAAAPGGPCNHPPDIACPNCAQSHMEARNAKKRAAARA